MKWVEENSVLILFLAFFLLYGLEFLIPLVRKKSNHFWSNVTAAAVLTLVNICFTSLTFIISTFADHHHFGLFQQLHTSLLVMIIVSIVAMDFWAGYLAHMIFHKYGKLWKFHSVHHSDDMVDVTTTFRQHPAESIIRVFFHLSGMALLGIPLWLLLIYMTLSSIHSQIEHANIHLPGSIDRLLQYVVVTPNMHKIHHSKYQDETDSNYGNIFSVWDRLFQTFRARKNYSTIDYGLDYLEDNRQYTYVDLIKLPFEKIHPEGEKKEGAIQSGQK